MSTPTRGDAQAQVPTPNIRLRLRTRGFLMTTLWSGVVQKMRVDAQDTVSYSLINATLDATEPERLAMNLSLIHI